MEQIKSKFISLFSLLAVTLVFSQTSTTKKIESLIIDNQLDQADSIVQKLVENGKSEKTFKDLSELVYWLGKIELERTKEQTFSRALKLIDFIKTNTKDPLPLYQVHIDLSRLQNETGDLVTATETADLAKEFALKSKDENALANSYYYLGEYNLRSGNINSFFENIKKGHQILLDNPNQKFPISARILNYMGAIKYFTAKPDSAYYFYQNALQKVGAMEDNVENRLYFPAAIKANMVLLKQSQNEYEEALQLAEECILMNKKFLKSSEKHPLRFRSQRNLSLAYRNLASLYEQTGDYAKSHQIAKIAYEHAQKIFDPKLLEYFSAMTLLAEAKTLQKDFDGALKVLDQAKKSLNSMEGQVPLLKANYHTILGGVLYGKKDFIGARDNYEKGNKFHKEAQNKSFSSDRLFAIMNLAMSYAQLGDANKADELLNQAIAQQTKNASADRILDALLVTKARSSNLLKDHKNVLSATTELLTKNSGITNKASYTFQAEAITLKAKAEYHLTPQKDVALLTGLEKELDSAISILENRKGYITSNSDINALIEENKEVFDFAKKINLELYQITKNEDYLNKVLKLHESSIYQRIRARLNLKNNISFSTLPKEIVQREQAIRSKLKDKNEDVDTFLQTSRAWVQFLDSLKIQFPKYHKMRYASLVKSLDNLEEKIPLNTTLVRYLHIDGHLYAFVNNDGKKIIIPLERPSPENIALFENFTIGIDQISLAGNQLYENLWKPIAHLVTTKNVIIFPDGELFNLSFEILSAAPIVSFKELAEHGLLAKHNISYNYSLLLLDNNKKTLEFENDFLGFAPEFRQEMKRDYELAISDSIYLDKSYLTLLPQPFSSQLIEKFSKRFKGKSFLNENASKQVFAQKAKEHKIIHIGTHAESNNVRPELSRLVFAKNVSDSTYINDNYLYSYEIYNQDLSSNLAILTACETGKPSYQPGEGMISLAHAFNYAGSESILTSLWQIDEKSSTEILEYFYEFLSDGVRKDQALRLAKLEYLKNAEGRTLHPQYWAGLVLMGNTSPIEISGQTNWVYWLIGLLVLTAIIAVVSKSRRS